MSEIGGDPSKGASHCSILIDCDAMHLNRLFLSYFYKYCGATHLIT
ncbi:MAG: hypothetical protein RI894_2026 [Bacteroidota bacterium]|jgi:hypothetical protein